MNELLKQLAAQAEKLGATAWDQAPLVFRDIVIAGLIKGGLGVGLGLVMLVVAGWGFRKARWEFGDQKGRCTLCGRREDDEEGWAWVIGSTVLLIVTLAVLSFALPDTLTAWLAPRAYLIHYLKESG